jgi:hypothetical protein
MINITIPELLTLWDELRDAEAGINRYGGNEAELYAYRFGHYIPSVDGLNIQFDPTHRRTMEIALSRANALYELLDHYSKERNVKIIVEGRALGRWLLKEPFHHRLHVTVTRKRK